MGSPFASAAALLSPRLLAGCLLVANCLGAGSLSFVNAAPARAQAEAPVPYSAVRALNLARNTAVQTNGAWGSTDQTSACLKRLAPATNA